VADRAAGPRGAAVGQAKPAIRLAAKPAVWSFSASSDRRGRVLLDHLGILPMQWPRMMILAGKEAMRRTVRSGYGGFCNVFGSSRSEAGLPPRGSGGEETKRDIGPGIVAA